MTILIILGVLVLLGCAAAAAYVYWSSSTGKSKLGKTSSDGNKKNSSNQLQSIGPVPMEDFVHLFNQLSPTSTHFDILWALLSMNDLLDRATDEIDKIEEMRQKKRKQLEEEKARKKGSGQLDFDDLVNDDGWGDEADDDDEDGEDGGKAAVQKAKEGEKRKQEEMERLQKVQGKTLPPMEGIDDGVLGQLWVESTLQKAGVWPPKLGSFGEKKLEYKPKSGKVQKLKPLEHPAFRRCLCMTMGRLHSNLLNTHQDLIKAGMNKAVDETYFRGSMEFRQRVALIMDASLRIALTIQSHSLFSTLVETLAAFKVGCNPTDSKSLPWFNGSMARQYNTLPRLVVGDLTFEESPPMPKEGEQPQQQMNERKRLTTLVAGTPAVIVVPVDRTHAESFTKTKLAQCQKQGIPPQVALQGYRESWWFLVRWESMTEGVENVLDDIPSRKFIDQLGDDVVKKFEATSPDMRVRTAFPMMVQNIAQKSGAVKVRIVAPANPGRYRMTVAVKSSDFLGADQEHTVEVQVQQEDDGDDDGVVVESEEISIVDTKKDK